jgi:mono/diheme cytochrome c family protein
MNRKIFLSLFAVFIVLTVAAALSCKDTQDDSTTIVFPSSGVTYTQHVGPLFQQRCAVSSCHTSTAKADGLDLTYPLSYTNLVNFTPTLIVNGKGSNSLLYKLVSKQLTPNMPPSGYTQLNSNQIAGVKTWIDEGPTSK